MRINHLLPLCFIILSLGACSPPVTQDCPDPPLVSKFLAQMHVKGDNAISGVVANDGAGKVVEMMDLTIGSVVAGSLTAYDVYFDEDGNMIVLTPDEIKRCLIQVDTLYIENPEPPYKLEMTLVTDTFDGDDLSSLRVLESWNLSESFILDKTVSYYVPIRENIDPITGELRGWTPMLYVPFTEAEGEPFKVATIQYTQPVINDSFYSVYEWYRENLEASVREKFFKPLLASMASGEMSCYAKPDESNALDKHTVAASISRVDTMYVENPAPPYDLEMSIVTENLLWTNVKAIEFVQELKYYKNGSIGIDVKWYRLVMSIPDPITGEPSGTKPLFWIKNS
jgi:hypothetical protein